MKHMRAIFHTLVYCIVLILSSIVQAEELTVTFEPSLFAEWYYISDSPSSVAEWYYFTNSPSNVAKWVYFTDNPELADISLTDKLNPNNEWIYISNSSSSVANWIYLSDSPSTVAEWVYITDSPKGADIIIYVDSPSLKQKKVIASILEYMKKMTQKNE